MESTGRARLYDSTQGWNGMEWNGTERNTSILLSRPSVPPLHHPWCPPLRSPSAPPAPWSFGIPCPCAAERRCPRSGTPAHRPQPGASDTPEPCCVPLPNSSAPPTPNSSAATDRAASNSALLGGGDPRVSTRSSALSATSQQPGEEEPTATGLPLADLTPYPYNPLGCGCEYERTVKKEEGSCCEACASSEGVGSMWAAHGSGPGPACTRQLRSSLGVVGAVYTWEAVCAAVAAGVQEGAGMWPCCGGGASKGDISVHQRSSGRSNEEGDLGSLPSSPSGCGSGYGTGTPQHGAMLRLTAGCRAASPLC